MFIPTYQVHKRISNLCVGNLEIELEASTNLMAAAGQVGGVAKCADGQLAAAVEWSSVRERELSVVSEHESVAGAATASLLTGNSQASRARAVGDGGGELEASIDLVVEGAVEIVVERALDGRVDVALGEVDGDLFALDGTIETETSLHTDVGRWASSGNDVKVERVLGIGVQVDVSLVVAPGELDLVQGWDWASGDWPAGNGGDLSALAVLKLNIGLALAWVQSLLDLQAADWAGVFDLKTRTDGVVLESALGGELEAVVLAGELNFVVSMLEALVEEVVGLFGEITVFDWHFE